MTSGRIYLVGRDPTLQLPGSDVASGVDGSSILNPLRSDLG